MIKMTKKLVKLQDIVDGMELQFEGSYTYLNRKTCEVITVSQEDLRTAEEEEEETFKELPDWQQEDLKVAVDIIENFEDYEELPNKFEINEYDMMENFCYSLENQRNMDLLLDAIRSKGAFRRFKDKVIHLGIDEKWYAYRDQSYKQIAIDWCRDNKVEYEE
jgi:hypothetical protein